MLTKINALKSKNCELYTIFFLIFTFINIKSQRQSCNDKKLYIQYYVEEMLWASQKKEFLIKIKI